MVNTSLLGAEDDDGVDGKCESSFSETLKVDVVPPSEV